MSYLQELNPKQREAAEYLDGPLLILAGAGAGKTKTLTYRIANLIKSGIAPGNILAVTFTNKAAAEMRERVDSLLQEEDLLKQPIEVAGRPTIRTFHSLGVLILRENFELAGLPKRFSILDRADSKKIVREALKANDYDPKNHDPAKILSIISRQKGDLVSIDEYGDKSGKHDYISEIVTTVWREYEKRLKKEGALDFDDLLVHSAKLLENNKDVLKRYQDRWKYIHIDEYQDTNEVQYKMSKLLAEDHKNICVVGDADQNIYSWRGATIKNIMNFEHDYPEAKEIVLEENYRSTQNILRAANEIISKNKFRKEKNLFTKNAEGEKVFVYQAIDEHDEATFGVLKAKELIADGTSPDEIVFLYRANFQSRVLEEVCLRNNLPHQVVGTRFFDRKEIKDVIAYIKAALNENDFTNLNRIINTPARGIGKATVLKIHAGEEDKLTPATKEKVANFRSLLKKIRDAIETKKPHEVIQMVMKEAGFQDQLKKEGDDGLERLENIRELASLAKKYEFYKPAEAMEILLEDISLATDQDTLEKNNGGVKLMTIHAAKGLEFDYVFVTGLEEGLFPHTREDYDKEDEEEERRLFYVAITRAKKKLFLTWAGFRTIFGSKQVNLSSEFLDDLSEDLLEVEDFNGGEGGNSEYLIDF